MEPLPNHDEQDPIAKAKRRWILLGVFGFGLAMFISTTALDYHDRPGLFVFNARGISRILGHLAIWLTGGYFWGLWMSRYVRKGLRR